MAFGVCNVHALIVNVRMKYSRVITFSPFELDGRCAGSSRSGWKGYAVLLGDTDRAVGYLK